MRLVLFAAALLVLGCRVSRRGAVAAVPGYLDFDNLPDTNFSCDGKVIGGYYADVETGCQMFHVCTIGQKGETTDIKFLCLNGTVFDQETRVCERVDEVDCSKTEGFYGLNLELYGNTGATYGIEEPEEAEDHEEAQSHPSQSQSSSPSTPTSPPPTTPKSTTPPTTPTTVISTTPATPPSTTAAHSFTPPTTISTISSTLHSFNQKPHTIHFSSTTSPHSVSSSFLTFPSGGDQLFETAPEGSGNHSPDLHHISPPSSSSSSWPQVNLQSGGGSGIIHQTDSSPFHTLKTTPKPVNLFGTAGHNNDHSNHQFIFSTTKAPSHFFSAKSPGGFSVTSHPPVTQFPLKNQGHLIQTNIPPDFYHDQQNRNRQPQKTSPSFLRHQSNLQIVPNPLHFQYTGRPTHQHQVFTTPSIQSTVVSSTSSVSSVKTTIKQDSHHNTQNPPANLNSFAFGINSGLSPSSFIDDKSIQNETKQNQQHLATPPTSYDEYHERDVALDPFFKDVPRISVKQGRSKRKRRQTQDNIHPSRGSRRFRNNSSPQQPITAESEARQSVPTNRRQSHRLPTNKQNSAQTTARFNTDSSYDHSTQTTEINRRFPVRQKSYISTEAPETTLRRDSAVQESQVRQLELNDRRDRPRQLTKTLKNEPADIPLPVSTTEIPSTTRQPLPETSFSCNGKVIGGYYADPEADCQLFHICVLGRHGKIRDDKFLCGPGTRFDQQSRTCQTKHLVNCSLATSLYHVNLPYIFPEDNEPIPDLMFESHKVSKRATRKGISRQDQESITDSLDNPPETDFSCEDKPQEGLYADVETECKYFHLCQKNKNGHLYLASTFICPSGTSFNQREGNCDASTEIDCEIYSQPEHSFAKSKSRNKRNTLAKATNKVNRKLLTKQESHHKGNAEDKSSEINYEDEETQSAEYDEQSNTSYENLSEEESHDSSLEDIHSKISNKHQEGSTSRNQEQKHGKKENSSNPILENNDNINHKIKHAEKSEEEEGGEEEEEEEEEVEEEEEGTDEAQSIESNENSSAEEKFTQSPGSTLSKDADDSEQINQSHELHKAEGKTRKTQRMEDDDVNLHSEYESLGSEQDEPSVEDESKEDIQDEDHEESYDENVNENENERSKTINQNKENYDENESTPSEDRNEEVSPNRPTKSNAQRNPEANINVNNTSLKKNHNDERESTSSTENDNESEGITSVESSFFVHPNDKSIDNVHDRHEPYNIQNSTSKKIEIENEKEKSSPIENSEREDGNKNSFLKNNSENTFKSKVNQLLMKLNASIEDISSINLNTSNDDYYDYYTDEESLLELEELKEKIISADNSAKNKQNNSEESITSEVEQFREEILAHEVPIAINTNQDLSKVQKQDPEFLSQMPETADNGSFTTIKYEESSLKNESDISPAKSVPENKKTFMLEEIPITTIKNEYETTEKELEKSNDTEYSSMAIVPNSTVISDNTTSTIVDQYYTTTENYEKSNNNSNYVSEQVTATIMPVLKSSIQINEDVAKQDRNDRISIIHTTSPSIIDNIYKDNTAAEEITSTEDTDMTTVLMTTFPLNDNESTTTTAPSTTSNLLHPYKSRPVYRTWRTTTPPPPVSIRPNTSLRLPRPSTRHGTNKGTSNNLTNKTEKEKTKPSNVHSNQILAQENTKEDHEVRNKQVFTTPLKEKSVELVHKTSTENVPLNHTPVTEQILDEIMSLTNSVSPGNNPTTIETQNFEQNEHTDSTVEKSDKTISYTSVEDYRTVDYDGMTPSSVLPTFSRKKFFIDRENQEVTKAGITTANPSTTPTVQAQTDNIPEKEGTVDESYSFTSVEAHTQESYNNNENIDSETFTCIGKELHQYIPDPFDCHLFHYCSPGFHKRQLLDFRFMCDEGTAFSPLTHHCEKEDGSLCGNLHN